MVCRKDDTADCPVCQWIGAKEEVARFGTVAAFKDVENFAREHKARCTGLSFDEVVNVLEAFVHGLNGRRLKVEVGEQAYTDTETLFLPATVSRFEQREDNFQLYKAMVVHQWAQTWYGTWRIDVRQALAHPHLPATESACEVRFHKRSPALLSGPAGPMIH